MCSPMHFILYNFEKFQSQFILGIIINACGINIEYFEPKYLFRRSNISDTSQQFFKITGITCLFEASIVQNKALNNEFLKLICCPSTELVCLDEN